MIKKILQRFALGFMFEVFAANLITILFSINMGKGVYYGINSGIMSICETELGAVIFQFLLAGGVGAVFGVSTLLWEIDKWSLAKQTVVHFFVITTVMLFTVYVCNWMTHSVKGFITWIGLFVVVYIIIWTICYSSYKRKIKEINKAIVEKNK